MNIWRITSVLLCPPAIRYEIRSLCRVMFVGVVTAALTGQVLAHCDTMDGPVVKAAQAALRTGNVNRVMIWVHPAEESELRRLFERVRRVRLLGREAKQLADLYFYETAVRLHRAGEGEAYTGLKPAGTQSAKIFVEIDNAISSNSAGELLKTIPEANRSDFEAKFRVLVRIAKFNDDDIQNGRQYVAAYVSFMHWFEGIEGTTRHAAH